MVKKSGTGASKKKKQEVKKKSRLPESLPITLPPMPLLREALICIVDEPRRWAKNGLASSALPRYAEWAAVLCMGGQCFFCGTKQEPVPEDRIFQFHPEYPLCQCLAPFRKMAFDYVENWDSVEGKKQILALVDAGKVSLDAPVYQYFCQCGEGPVIVDFRTIAYGLRKHQKHSRRRLCNKCYQNAASKRTQLRTAMEVEASKAKGGPGARINKIKQTKNVGPSIPPLPPLKAVLPDAQIAEAGGKPPEKVSQQHS